MAVSATGTFKVGANLQTPEDQRDFPTAQFTQIEQERVSKQSKILTSPTTIELTVAIPGWALFEFAGVAAPYIEIGVDNAGFVPFARLIPDVTNPARIIPAWAWLPVVPGTVYQAQANTATDSLSYRVWSA